LDYCVISITPPPPQINPNAQFYHASFPIQSSHASKRIKTDVPKPKLDKGKGATNLAKSSKDSSKSMSSHIHLKDIFSHVVCEIHSQGPNKLKIVAQEK
jgi:hypothetical protein